MGGTIFSAVGHEEVIKMEYEIGLGALEADGPDTLLAYTTSYELGITLSEIKWGFFNTNETGEKESSYIEFTLHDIAGVTLPLFIDVKGGAKYIFFKGPTSSGNLWSGAYAVYQPIQEGCQLEFSQTQGFTYRFSGSPLANTAKTQKLSIHSKITMDGLDYNNKKHGNTFEDYLAELEYKWNSMLNCEKKGTAMIKLTIEDGASELKAQTPYQIEPENPQPKTNTGDPVSRVKHFAINPGTPIARAIQSFWQERFAGKETDPAKNINAGSILEVNFTKYDGSTNHINVRLQRKRETDDGVSPLDVCIGDDVNCAGATYRAQLTGIDFGGLLSYMGQQKIIDAKEQEMGEVTAIGSDSITCTPAEKTKGGADKQDKETVANIPQSVGLPVGNDSIFDGGGELATFFNRYKEADFSLEMELPYSFGFTPTIHGGVLEPSEAGIANGGIHYLQGVLLRFFWYTDVTCEYLALVPAISTDYRVTSVTHTIGLSGNVTQVKLSHKNVSAR